MKNVLIPEAARISAPDGKDVIEYTLHRFVAHLLNTDQRFNTDGVGIRSAVRIEAALKVAADAREKMVDLGINDLGEVPMQVALEEADWARLRDAAEAPTAGYPISPARACAAFVDAIANAK